MTCEPASRMSAPILFRKLARSTISGSRAAFSMIVRPFAVTAPIITFSVAPTLGKSRVTMVPLSPWGTLAWMLPCSLENSTPSALRPARCWSIERAPRLQPPGMDTTALPKRVMRGPRIEMLARIFETSS